MRDERCKAKNNSNYVFKALPGGKPFQCAAWRADLDILLPSQVAKAALTAPCASSQQNESFNSMCAAKEFIMLVLMPMSVGAVQLTQKIWDQAMLSRLIRKQNKSSGGITRKYREKQQELCEKKAMFRIHENSKVDAFS